MKYIVVDVHALAYRALYGYPKLTNNNGESTSVIVGFFKQFFSFVSDIEDYYPVFVADSGKNPHRLELLPQYKGTRSKQDDDFYRQIDFILEICAMFGTVYKEYGYEADDLAACFIDKYVTPDDDCLLVTVDQDWLQLLARNIKILQLKPNHVHVTWTDELFYKEFEFTPKQLVDYKAIIGDKSDNIPGVNGVGPKQATELIKEFGSVENLYKNIVKVFNTRKLQEHLIESEGVVAINKKLVTLSTDIKVLMAPDTKVTQDVINVLIDRFIEVTDATALTDMLGVYLQKRKA